MRSDLLGLQRRASLAGAAGMSRDELLDRVATQRTSADAGKHSVLLGVEIPSQPCVQDGRRVPLKRRAALLASLALAAYMRARADDDIATSYADQFRDPQPRVDGDEEQDSIATPNPGGRVGRGEQRGNLGAVEERDRLLHGALARHRQHPLAQERVRRFGQGHVAKEGMDRGQAGIAGARAVATAALEMLE